MLRVALTGGIACGKSVVVAMLRELGCPVIEADPLAPTRFPVHWVGRLFAWDERSARYPPMDGSLTVIQGLRDTAVDWKYNLPYLRERFGAYSEYYVEGGTHNLYRYSGTARQALESVLDECLGPRG